MPEGSYSSDHLTVKGLTLVPSTYPVMTKKLLKGFRHCVTKLLGQEGRSAKRVPEGSMYCGASEPLFIMMAVPSCAPCQRGELL